MNLHLRVLHGTLKRQDGGSAGSDIAVHGHRFVIGGAEDCHMRCASGSISQHHCELVSEQGRVSVRDLGSETGTLVNNEKLVAPRILANGDHLRVGRLEFEIVLLPPKRQAVPAKDDPVADEISQMLTDADAEDRTRQLHDPSARIFKAPAPAPAAAEVPEKKKLERPIKKPPGKLPPPPKIIADNTVDAAAKVLDKFFEAPKKKH